MTEIGSILLHLDTGAGSAARLALAHALADQHGARITVLFGVHPQSGQASFAYSAGAALHAAEERDASIGVERDRLRALSDLREPECFWCDVVGDSVLHGFVAEAAYADLVILGQPARRDLAGAAPSGFVESIILQSGTPAIVVPDPHRQETVGESVLLAWNGSPQSARALHASLPFLRRARQVRVVTWAQQPPSAPFSALDVRGLLERHGIAVELHRRAPTAHVDRELGALATELGADLIVMGCYGHSRLRERVFGGVTRGLLATLPVPVLMAH